jgi:hypothetical protein
MSKIAIISFILLPFVSVLGRIAHVPSNYANIQSGISSCVNDDTVMVASGTYIRTGNHDIDFHGKRILVVSESGPESTIIDCQGVSGNPRRGFYFHSGENTNSIVSGFTIRNGYVEANNGGGGICSIGSSPLIINCHIENSISMMYGGGMYCTGGATPVIRQCRFESNGERFGAPAEGGGLACENGSVHIDSCVFSGNSAMSWGGGVYLYNSAAEISNCEFINNATTLSGTAISQRFSQNVHITNCYFSLDSSITDGGAFHAYQSRANLDSCTFENNYSMSMAAGAFLDQATGEIANCEFTNNFADIRGGAVAVFSTDDLLFFNCKFTNNYTGIEAGAIFLYATSPTFYKCNFYLNHTSDAGGDILTTEGSPRIINCVFDSSSSSEYSTVKFEGAGTPIILNSTFYRTGIGISDNSCHPTIINTIMAHSPRRAINCDYHLTDVTLAYSNLFGNHDGNWIGCVDEQGNIRGNTSVDPAFRDINGRDFRLKSIACGDSTNSFCIDAGDPAILDDSLDCEFGLGSPRSDMGAYGGGDTAMVNTSNPGQEQPILFALDQNFPNPFNPSTKIEFTLEKEDCVSLNVYDIQGRKIATPIISEKLEEGPHQVNLDLKSYPSGIYLYVLSSGKNEIAKKMLLVK